MDKVELKLLSYMELHKLKSVIYSDRDIKILMNLDENLVSTPLDTLIYLDSCLAELNISLLSLLSEEQRKILLKKGGFIIKSTEDDTEKLYSPDTVIYHYRELKDYKNLIEAMILDGADIEIINSELNALDSYLRNKTCSVYEKIKPVFTREHYERAKTYVEVEGFVDGLQESLSMTPEERLDIISELTDYTLALNGSNTLTTSLSVEEKVLTIFNK